MTESRRSDSDTFHLMIRPEGSGWRVTVMKADRYGVATAIENTLYEAASIGVGLWHRWKAANPE